jgi:hypothetical protein
MSAKRVAIHLSICFTMPLSGLPTDEMAGDIAGDLDLLVRQPGSYLD